MSYILDSLKKAEQKRQENAAGDVQVPMEPGNGRPRRRNRLALLIIIVLLVIGVGAAVLLSNRQPGKAPVVKAVNSRPAVTTSAAPIAPAPPAAGNRPSGQPEKTVEPSTTPATAEAVRVPAARPVPKPVEKPEPVKKSEATRPEVLAPEQLPPGLRDQAYRLRLTLHYFAPDPARRLVRLEGRMLHEGEGLADGLRVVRIERTGVVLAKDGYRFRLNKP
ncbi:MAG: hypothetical protein Tsb0017_21680 [Geothermobacteraceae bacterium]